MLIIDSTCKTVHNLPLAEHAWKFVPRMLSVRDEIGSAYAQHAIKLFPRMLSIRITHAIIFENDSKIPT